MDMQGAGELGRAGSKAGGLGVGTGPLLRATQVTPSRSHRQAPAKGGCGGATDRPQQGREGRGTGQAWWVPGNCPWRPLRASAPRDKGAVPAPGQVPAERETARHRRCLRTLPGPRPRPAELSWPELWTKDLRLRTEGLSRLCPRPLRPPFSSADLGWEAFSVYGRKRIKTEKNRSLGLPFLLLPSPSSPASPAPPGAPEEVFPR